MNILIPLAFAVCGYESNVKKSEIWSHLFNFGTVSPEFHLEIRFFDIVMHVFYVYNCLIMLIRSILNLRSCNFNCKVQIRQLFLNQWLKHWQIKKSTQRTHFRQVQLLCLQFLIFYVDVQFILCYRTQTQKSESVTFHSCVGTNRNWTFKMTEDRTTWCIQVSKDWQFTR